MGNFLENYRDSQEFFAKLDRLGIMPVNEAIGGEGETRNIERAFDHFQGDAVDESLLRTAIMDNLENIGLFWIAKGGDVETVRERVLEAAAPVKKRLNITDGELEQLALNCYPKYTEKERRFLGVSNPIYRDATNIEREIAHMNDFFDYSTECFRFGIDLLDDAMTGGVMRKQILSIIGAPNCMKTSLLLNGIADWIDRGNQRVTFFSLDMDVVFIMQRLIMRELRCGWNVFESLRRARTDEYRAAEKRVIDRYQGKLHIIANGTKRINLDDVCKHIRYVKPDIVVIDYLTLLKDIDKNQSDYDIANRGMALLQEYTRAHQCITVIVSQMSLESRREQERGGAPAARGGGIVSEIADVEIALFKKKDFCPDMYGERLTHIIANITKNRKGESGRYFDLDFKGASMLFTGMATEIFPNAPKKNAFTEAFGIVS